MRTEFLVDNGPRWKSSYFWRGLVVALALFCGAVGLHAQAIGYSDRPPIPHFTQSPVIDQTGTLSAEQVRALDSKLRTWEDTTSNQIAILVIPTLNDFPIEEYSVAVFDSNHFGQAGKNNGALVVIAMNDHKFFITTGYGLEPVLPDAAVTEIERQMLIPELKKGDLYTALDKTTTAMIETVAGEFTAPESPVSSRGKPPRAGIVFFVIAAFFIILVLLRAMFGTGARRTIVGSTGSGSGCLGGILQGLFWSSILNSGRGGRDNWGGFGAGGGFGGGGFGGGGGWGGGGGSTGGGGAGGSW